MIKLISECWNTDYSLSEYEFYVGQEGLAMVGSIEINNCILMQNIKAQLGWNSQSHCRKLGVIDWCDLMW